MSTWVSSTKDSHETEPKLPTWSRKALFTKTKPSDEWHQQVHFTAGGRRPSDHNFPWDLIKRHTDHYIKKKGKIASTEIDVKLVHLIEQHESREVAIAACAHVMSPSAIRAILNVEIDVGWTTFFGLEGYLQSLIAANHCSPKAVTDLEATWARGLLPYTKHGANAAGRYLEGMCVLLRTHSTQNMNNLPDFYNLARRASRTFATQLNGMKLRCQWVAAHNMSGWMATLAQSPAAAMPLGELMPEALMDTQLPSWRIWARWRPNINRITRLEKTGAAKRAVLYDFMALEGPDFINGTQETLKEGIVKRYTAGKPLVEFKSLIIEVKSGTSKELGDLLERTSAALEAALAGGEKSFELFVQVAIREPISPHGLRLLEAVSRFQDTPASPVYSATLEIYLARGSIGGGHIMALKHLIRAIGDARGEELGNLLLFPWFIQGVVKCIKECQTAVRKHIDTGLAWTQIALELHSFLDCVHGLQECERLLTENIQRQLSSLPSVETVNTLLEVYAKTAHEKMQNVSAEVDVLKIAIAAWFIDRLLERGTLRNASQTTVDAFILLWNNTTRKTKSDSERRLLALLASRHAGEDFALRSRCVNYSMQLPDKTVGDLVSILQGFRQHPELSSINFTRLLGEADAATKLCWRGLLYELIRSLQPMAIIDYAIANLKVKHFYASMLDFKFLFADWTTESTEPRPFIPVILQSRTHDWLQQLSPFLPVMQRLESVLGDHSSTLGIVLSGGDRSWDDYLKAILEALTVAYEQPAEGLIQRVFGILEEDGSNVGAIEDFAWNFMEVTPEGLAICERIWDAKHGVGVTTEAEKLPLSLNPSLIDWVAALEKRQTMPPAVIEVMIAGWLRDDSGLLEKDKEIIANLAAALDLKTYIFEVPEDKLAEATAYFKEQEVEVLEQAKQLRNLTRAMKAKDPLGTKLLLESLGIEDVDPLDEELQQLSVTIAGAVEKCGDNEVEISFPLSEWTDLQRSAMGVGDAKALLVRLYLDLIGDMPVSFCVHLESDTQAPTKAHTPWTCLSNLRAPEHVYCSGKATVFTWQMSRVLSEYIKTSGANIAELHDFVKLTMDSLAQSCPVCGFVHNSRNLQLYRSTPCTSPSCISIWDRLPLDVRFPEIRTDPLAVDILLTTVYAAAMKNRSDLLFGCPILSPSAVQEILNSLPSMKTLQNSKNISLALRFCDREAENLLVWALSQFRGYVSTASGSYKIPGMPPGTHQFILANAAPSLEAVFAANLSVSQSRTKVLFHGTSLDRLPSILTQGLQIHSGTSLQRSGAAHGRGIYLGEEPATSFAYAPSGVSWKNSDLNHRRLLLGCEVVGDGRIVAPGIHALQDNRLVMVRYMFMLGAGSYAPNANHVVPAMTSAISAMRSGVIKRSGGVYRQL